MPIAGEQIIFPESGRGLGHVTPTIFGGTVGYPSDSLASCLRSTCSQLGNYPFGVQLLKFKESQLCTIDYFTWIV